MPSIIPKAFYCANCKTELKKKVCDCGAKCKPLPPYTVRFRWINEKGEEEHKRLSGTPPWNTQNAAQKGYEQWIAEHPSHPKAETQTFDFMPLYAEYKMHLRVNVKESSYLAITQRIDKYVVPDFGNRKVNEITPADLLKWQNMVSDKGLAVKYKAAIRGAFNHFFEYLKIYRISNPFDFVKGFKHSKETKREMEYWTQSEFETFISVVEDLRFKCVFSFLYLTGCRKGEACALKWDDIDFNNSTVKINKTLSVKTDKSRSASEGELINDLYRVTTPKTDNSYRTILMPPILTEYLSQLYEERTSDFVFGINDSVLPFQTLSNAFNRYIKLSGVKPIRIHDLRHSHASLLINKGENQLSTIYVIAARLGDTVEMIFKTYGHLFPNTQRDIIEKLDVEF